ncbi:hypothetical protein DZC72_05945 [Maribacter algicola]|uniref:Uncharacterized protein n=1 Tax=Maribacter algicola TaxID=2498892 RepID=A0A426RM90_9FLAO|nr:hypothetical protein DZC72_05945 [Maribacter algicola]
MILSQEFKHSFGSIKTETLGLPLFSPLFPNWQLNIAVFIDLYIKKNPSFIRIWVWQKAF